ncbi:MAG: Hsp20/alpha crystallin family protein [Bacteroidota bacterium]
MKLAVRNNRQYPSFNSLFNDLFGEEFGAFNGGTNVPAVNVKEENEQFVLEVSVPGRKKEDFNIKLDDKTLTISSEWKEESAENDEKAKYSRREFRYGSFSRSFSLPKTVDGEKINARYENGILFLSLPKREEAQDKGTRQIEIS